MGDAAAVARRAGRDQGGADLGNPPDKLDLAFERGDLVLLGEGRVASDLRQIYTLKTTGEFAYTRLRRVELTVRDGKVSRYEMRSVA